MEKQVDIKSLEIKIVPISELKIHPKNSKKHPESQIKHLCKMIRATGFRVPIIAHIETKVIGAGHCRLEAAKRLGMTEVPVIFQKFDSEGFEGDDEFNGFNIGDNGISEWGKLDFSLINAQMEDFGPMDTSILGLQNWLIDPNEEEEKKTKSQNNSPKWFACPNCSEKVDLKEYGL